MEFVLDDSNPILREYYSRDNYRDIILREGGSKCIIFFSGNGIYVPNDNKAFEDVIIEKDRYEWENLSDSEEIKSWADRIIYVRDIYKSWYATGINEKISSVDEVIKWVSRVTQGWDVVTCGNSAGGYMAAIVGSKIGAKCVFSFGGQWNITHALQKYRLVQKGYSENGEYLDLTSLLKENRVPIFWFYSAQCQIDLVQYRFFTMNKIPCVYDFAMDSDEHGFVLLNGCYKKLLPLDIKQVIGLYEKYQGKIINLRRFCLELMDLKEAWPDLKKDIVKHHRSLQILREYILSGEHKR